MYLQPFVLHLLDTQAGGVSIVIRHGRRGPPDMCDMFV